MKPAVLLLFCLPALALAQSNTGAELRNSGTDYVRICGPSTPGQSSPYAAGARYRLGTVTVGGRWGARRNLRQ